MKKMFKAVASLAVGCALLSTSAFAALDGTVSYSENTIGANITLDSAQSTVLVLKGAKTAMPASIADSDIAYINQETVSNGAVTYSMPVDGTTAYTVFAGGTNESAAKLLGVVNFAIIATATEVDENATITLTTNAGEGTAVAWESDNTAVATVNAGVVTGVKAGSANITAKIMNGDDVLASATQAITVKAPVVEDEAVYLPGVDGTVEGVGTVKIANINNNSKAAWWTNFERGSKKVKVAVDALLADGADANDYMVKVVDSEGKDVDTSNYEVYYSAENKFFVVLVNKVASDAGFKFEIVNKTGANTATKLAKFGETNSRGSVNMSDANLIAAIYTESAANTLLTNAQVIAADVNHDANINMSDANMIAAKYSEVITSYTIEN